MKTDPKNSKNLAANLDQQLLLPLAMKIWQNSLWLVDFDLEK